MAPKRLERQQLRSLSSSAPEKQEEASHSKVESSLEPKPCHTCGRQITPRAKWARNWSSIRYCSDQCKGWKSIVRVGKASERLKEKEVSNEDDSLLEKCLIVKEANLLLHLDAWIEGTMMHLVSESDKEQHIKSEVGVPLLKVSELMHLDLQRHSQSQSSYYSTIKDELLQHAPGEREMIRRAARRLVILPPETTSFAKHFGRSEQHYSILLTQNNGKSILETLQKVSFAKGEMYIHRGRN